MRLSEKHIFRGILNSEKITANRSTTICLMKMLRNVRIHHFFDNLLCKGTMVLYVFSNVTFCIEIWLPLCRTSTKPAFFNAFTSFFPDKTGSLGMSNFNGGPEWSRCFTWQVFCPKTFNIKSYSFFDV